MSTLQISALGHVLSPPPSLPPPHSFLSPLFAHSHEFALTIILQTANVGSAMARQRCLFRVGASERHHSLSLDCVHTNDRMQAGRTMPEHEGTIVCARTRAGDPKKPGGRRQDAESIASERYALSHFVSFLFGPGPIVSSSRVVELISFHLTIPIPRQRCV